KADATSPSRALTQEPPHDRDSIHHPDGTRATNVLARSRPMANVRRAASRRHERRVVGCVDLHRSRTPEQGARMTRWFVIDAIEAVAVMLLVSSLVAAAGIVLLGG